MRATPRPFRPKVPCRWLLLLLAGTGASGSPPAAAEDPGAPGLDPHKALHHYVHEVWTMEDGLPSNTIRDILQTPDGYLWLATHNGLARFDGVRFKAFDPRNTSGLQTTVFVTLCLGRDGTLWAGSQGGLVRYRDGEFSTLSRVDGLASESVQSLLEDQAGVLWIAAGGVVHRLEDGILSQVELPDEVALAWVNSIAETPDGTLWFATRADGLLRQRAGEWHVLSTRDGLFARRLRFVYVDGAGAVWLSARASGKGPLGRGLLRYRNERFVDVSGAEGFFVGETRSLHEGREGGLWVGTTGGLGRFVDGRFARFEPARPLTDTRFLAFHEDRDGSLWMGTFSGGLQRFKAGPVTTYSGPDGLANRVLAVYEDRDRQLWVGGWDGLSRYEDGRFVPEAGIPRPIRAIGEDPNGALWLGTRYALLRYSQGELERYPIDFLVTLVHPDRQGTVWVALERAGVRCFSDGVFTVVEELSGEYVRWIHEDRDGVLWFGTNDSGLFRLEGDRFTRITTADGLSSDAVLSFHEDDEGALWIGTEGGGLNRLKDGTVTHYSVRDGLHDDTIWPILEDDRGNLWMGGDRGVFRVRKQDFADLDAGRIASVHSVAYGVAEGMKTLEGVGLGDPSGWKTRDGRLWFATMAGLAMIDPNALGETLPPPAVLFEDVLADGAPIERDGEPVIPVGTRGVEIRFTAPSLRKPEAVQLQHILDGQDPEWQDTGPSRTTQYQRLPPDSYRFRVRARHGAGAWGEEATLLFTVLPAWWQTWWFRGATGGAVLALAASLVLLVVRQRERRRLVLQERRDELAQLGRLAAVGELTTTLGHELRQPLAAIRANAEAARRFLRSSDMGEVETILDDILRDDGRAADLIERVRGLVKKRPFSPESLDVNVIIEDVLRLVEADAAKRRTTLLFEAGEELPRVEGDRVQLEQVLMNLTLNGLDAMDDAPTRRLELRTTLVDGSSVQVSVRDTGRGAEGRALDELFGSFYTTKSTGIGLGLSISRSIVEAHGGKIWATKNPDRGLTFQFTVPVASS